MKNLLVTNRNFLKLWIGQAISICGDFVLNTTLVLWITTSIAKDQSWAPIAVSGVFFANSFSVLLIGPLAGVFVDRWKKRLTMLQMDVFRLFIILLLIAVPSLVQYLSVQHNAKTLLLLLCIYIIVILESACAQFFNPSRLALIGDIVPDEQHSQAMGLMQSTTNLAIIFGPPLGTLLFFGVGVYWSILLDALSFLVSFCFILTIHTQETQEKQPRKKFWLELREGASFYVHNKVLVTLLLTGVVFMSGGSAFNALYIFFVTQNLQMSGGFYSILAAAAGLGAVLGATVVGQVVKFVGLTRLLPFSLILWGTLLIVMSRFTIFFPVLIIFFLLGILNAGVNVSVGPLLLKSTPKEFVGRAVAVLTPTITAASMLSTIVAGYFSSTVLMNLNVKIFAFTFHSIDTIFTIVGILAIVSGIYALRGLN